ncbi:MAG: hypothetical protein KGL92_07485 [Gammaproteobacteria bacterium]|nr:hypothetical protein [Gammaproteobacteria bacterium]
MKIPLILLATLLLAACASRAVRCDTRLSPINLTASLVHAHATAAAASGGRPR